MWTRPTSQQLTSTLLAQGSKYHDTLQAAQKADRIVRAKVNNWGKAIDLLSHPVNELINHLPSVRDDGPDSQCYPQLQELLQRLRSLLQECSDAAAKRKRTVEEAEALAKSDDISDALLRKATELTRGSPVVKIEPEQFQDVFDRELKKYEGLLSQVEQYDNEQARCLSRIRDVHEQFTAVVRSNSVATKRQKAILNLEQAFVKFKEIRTNLVEGIKVSFFLPPLTACWYMGHAYLFRSVLFPIYRYSNAI